MRLLPLAATAATTIVCLAAAAPAGAAFYNGAVDTGDHTTPVRTADVNGPTSCAADPSLVGASFGPFTYDQFAFRNNGTTASCVTVSSANTSCALGTFDVTASPGGALLGSDAPCSTSGSHAHAVNVLGRNAFLEFVSAPATGRTYDLEVTGTNIVPALVASINNADLGDGNSVRLSVSSLENGTDVLGTVNVSAGIGHAYGGNARCLRVSGANASVVVPFNVTAGLDAKWKGAVYWIHQSLDGQSDGQRNSLLTQHQLDTTYSSCPDPSAPPHGSFRTISLGGTVHVVSNGPQGN
jgi:hypothetical protein